MGRTSADRGQLTGFLAITSVGLVFMAGLAYDGGQYIRAYLEASDLAEAAARAGAQATGPDDLLAGVPVLDPSAAAARVDAFVAAAGHPGAATVAVSPDEISVTVTLDQSAHILPLGPKQISATATATPNRGVNDDS